MRTFKFAIASALFMTMLVIPQVASAQVIGATVYTFKGQMLCQLPPAAEYKNCTVKDQSLGRVNVKTVLAGDTVKSVKVFMRIKSAKKVSGVKVELSGELGLSCDHPGGSGVSPKPILGKKVTLRKGMNTISFTVRKPFKCRAGTTPMGRLTSPLIIMGAGVHGGTDMNHQGIAWNGNAMFPNTVYY